MKDSNPKQDNISLSKGKRWLVFLYLCFLNSCLMIGAGIISSGIVYIRESFKISDQEYGLIGTAFNAGSLIGSSLFISLSHKFNRKYLMLIELGFHCVALLICSITNQFYIFLVCRLISGNGIVIWFIFNMVWIDQFGIQKWKSWMVSLISLSGQLSMLWGYVLNLVTDPKNWTEGLRIEFGLMLSILIILCFIPNLYFSHNLFFKTKSEEEVAEKVDERLDSVFAYTQAAIVIEKSEETKEKPTKTKASLFTPMFIIITLGKSAQFFVGGTIAFWFTDYAQSALKVTDQTAIFYSFTFVNIVANLIGIVLSGIISAAIGGYASKHTLLTCFILKLVGFPFGAIVPFTNNFVVYSILLFCYNVFDSLSLLLSNCLIMAYVPQEMKGAANGVFSILANFLAFLPATYIYGLLKKHFNEVNPKMPFAVIMYYGSTALIYFFIGLIIQKKTQLSESQFEEKKKEKEKEVLLQNIKVSNQE